MKTSEWKNCYSEQWKGILIEQAFVHPAKVSLALAKRIFEHAFEKCWLKKGDTVLDPFSGIGGFAFPASLAGVNFVGMELEKHFVDLANGVDCSGISKDEWVRFYGRLDKAKKFCPTCIAQAKQITEPKKETVDLFGKPLTASYERNSGKIPSTLPHHFEGNLEFWKRRFNLNGAVIVQGDSRKLLEVIKEQLACCVSSPPYNDAINFNGEGPGMAGNEKQRKRIYNNALNENAAQSRNIGYGQTSGNLGNLPTGNFEAVISSPPFGEAQTNEKDRGTNFWENAEKKYNRKYTNKSKNSGYPKDLQGNNSSNLGNLPATAQGFDAAISSPPYAQSIHDGNGIDGEKLTGNIAGRNSQAFAEGYGESSGQLGAMRGGSFSAVVSSPPYESDVIRTRDKWETNVFNQGHTQGQHCFEAYGQNENQLASESGENFWSAAKQIVEQTFLALKPGAHAIFVCKNFVRHGEIVEFSKQWAQLCESVGFKLVCWHHASLVENGAVQLNTEGKEEIKVTERKSFFRRLCEKNGSPRIDFEDVICLQKPIA